MSLLCFSFLCLVSCAFGQDALKAMPLGRVQPVQTLVARPQGLSSGPHAGLLNDSHLAPGKLTDQNAGPVKDDGKRGHSLFPVADIDHASSTEPAGDEFGLYVPYDERSGTTLVRPGLTKRATFRGTMMMNCKRSLEACQNACWYQNCIKGARGDPAKAPYTFMYSSNNDVNRVEAGTMLSQGTPCQNWPFGQRMWDSYPWDQRDTSRKGQKALQTDEWPMADFDNTPFDKKTDPVSLRCITGTDNSRGATEWTNFRDKAGDKYKAGGIYDDKRPAGRMVTGDTFHVDFDMSEFDDNKREDVDLKKTLLYYCTGNFNDCKNDGRQFHMTDLVKTTTRQLNVGEWAWPYDPANHNTYTIDKEPDVMKSYFVTIEVEGDDRDQFQASVTTYNNGAYTNLASAKAQLINDGDSMAVRGGKLPRDLKITRQNGGGCDMELDFLYGDPAKDGIRWFSFKSSDKSRKTEYSWDSRGRYCIVSDMKEGQDVVGVKYECSFPGW